MKYTELQRKLKQDRIAGLVKVKLNSSGSVLEAEYRRCLQLRLSQSHLERLVVSENYECLESIFPSEIEANLNKFLLRIIKEKAYNFDSVEALAKLKLAFLILKDPQYDFRTKVSWARCVYSIGRSTID